MKNKLYTKSSTNRFNRWMLFTILFVLSLFNVSESTAVLPGPLYNIPGDYVSLAAAITDLNAQGVSGPVTFNLIAGNPQDAPVGGYVIGGLGSLVLTSTSAANTVTFQGNGNIIKAADITGQAAGILNDAIFKLVGADYITLTGFTMIENPLNIGSTAEAAQRKTEWGVGLFYVSPIDGANNNTITNNDISLDGLYQNTFGIYSNTRHTDAAPLVVAAITSAAGSNSLNKIYSNVIHNVNIGIALIGSAVAGTLDDGNDIGGSVLATGNTVTNWGKVSVARAAYPSLTTVLTGIFEINQSNNNISFNTVISSPLVAMSGTISINGILTNYSTGAIVPTTSNIQTVNNNTITITNTPQVGASGNNEMIQVAGMTVARFLATLTISNNLIQNCTIAGANAGGCFWRGIRAANAVNIVNIDNNTLKGNVLDQTFGQVQLLRQAGAVQKDANIRNNKLGDATANCITWTQSDNEAHFGIIDNGGTGLTTHTITGNDFRSPVGSFAELLDEPVADLYIRVATSGSQNVSNNTFTNLSVRQSGQVRFFEDLTTHAVNTTIKYNNNSIVGSYKVSSIGNLMDFRVYTNAGITPDSTVLIENIGNNFSNITMDSITATFGWLNSGGATANGPHKIIKDNVFNNWTFANGPVNAVLRVDFSFLSSTTNVIRHNTVSNITTTGAVCNGIVSAAGRFTTDSNTVHDLSTTGTSCTGILVIATPGSLDDVKKNKVCNLRADNALGVVTGILVQGSGSQTAGIFSEVSNNIVGNLRTPNSDQAGNSIVGLSLVSDSLVKVYYNTIYLDSTSSGAQWGSAAISVRQSPFLRMKNNIFANNTSPKGSQLAIAFSGPNSGAAFPTEYSGSSNNNDYFGSTIYDDGGISAGSPFGSLLAYQAFITGAGFAQDQAAISQLPPFISTNCNTANYLHIDPTIGSRIESGGINGVTSVTTDIDGDLRFGAAGYAGTSTSAPDIGADEFNGLTQPGCSGVPAAGSISGSSAVCTGSGTNLSLSGASQDIGISYQWFSGITNNGPYPNTLGTASLQATGPLTVTTYFICKVTCSNGGGSATTGQKTITINPLPVVTVSPTSSSICNPGGSAITLTAAGAVTYLWAPKLGLTPAAGTSAVESSNPLSSTSYIVTGTDGNGCKNTASASVTVSNTPSSIVATATPSTICSGSTSQLDVTANISVPSYANTYSFSASNGIFVPLTGAVNLAAIQADDVAAFVPIGFGFKYEGVTYTQTAANSNGFLSFGPSGNGLGQGNILASNVIRPALAPLQDDLSGVDGGPGTTFGTASYKTEGLPGSQTFTFEWLNWYWDFSNAVKTISFQVKLYEANGRIDFIYRPEGGTPTSAAASIGISSSIVGNFLSLSDASAAPSISSITETGNISGVPASGQTYTFTPPVPVVSYAWTPPGSLNNAAIKNPLATPPNGTTTYTVTITNTGCSATGTTSVTAGVPLVCSAATVSGTACAGQDFTVTAHSTGGGSPFNYAWSDGVGGVYPNAQSITANLPAGTYTFDCTITDACNPTGSCVSSVVKTVSPTPSAAISPAGPSISCTAAPLILTRVTDFGTTFQWKRNGVNLGTGSTQVASSSGSYTVVISAGGCSSESAANVVTVVTNASAPNSITPTNINVCQGASTSPNFTGNCTETTMITAQPDSSFNGANPGNVVTTQGPNGGFDWSGNNGFLNISTVRIPVSGFPLPSTITNVSVTFGLAHTRGGDMVIDLISPSGTDLQVLFSAHDSVSILGTNGLAPTLPYTFNSTGTKILDATGVVPSPGPYLPFNSFAGFNGLAPNGNWLVTVRDNVNGQGGKLDNVSIKITATSPTGTVDWYKVASGGTLLASTTSFNPIINGGASTATAHVDNFYAECSNSGCANATRTHVTFTVAPCPVTFSSKIFLQGYYIGGGTMQNTLFAQDGGAPHSPTDVDSITISAMDAAGTHNLVDAKVAILKTNGDVTVNFGPAVIANSPYYIKVNHSNSVETWSATAITLPPVAFYSFALDSAQAFASNEAMFEDVNGPDGNAKIYAADINQDGAVDGSDFLVLDPDIQAGAGGYIVTDVNGDGAVDGSDFLVFDPNSQDGRGIITPP